MKNRWLIEAPVLENLLQDGVMRSIETNAEFHSKAGMKPKIVRKTDGKCCEWCSKIAGAYTYPDGVPPDVYRRHKNCTCTVEYYPGDGKKQDVWSKKWSEDSEEFEKRKAIGLAKTSKEELERRKTVGLAETDKRHIQKPDDGGIINLEDIQIYKSLGAKARNYDVMDLDTGEIFHFAEGTRIQDVQVFAGKGVKAVFRTAEKYAKKYGGAIEDWQHVKGIALLTTPDGDRKASVHWSQCDGIGKVEFFVKEWLD